jgi:hypothetical protein
MAKLIKGITSDHDLIELADKLNIHLDDVLTISEATKQVKNGTYIILLRADDGVGHWVCCHNGEYFDSTGVGPPTKLGDMSYNQFQYQSTYDQFCGIWCILWLYSKQKHSPDLLKGFHNLDVDFV